MTAPHSPLRPTMLSLFVPMSAARRALALFVVAIGVAGCGGGGTGGSSGGTEPSAEPGEHQVCTMLPCLDHVAIVTELSAAQAATGLHRFRIEADGTTVTCTVNHTDATATDFADCDGSASLHLGPRTQMVEVPSPVPGTVMVTAQAVPGVFQWGLELSGQPASVRVVHELNGVVLRDQSATPTYREERPNGRHCEPVCQQASITWALQP